MTHTNRVRVEMATFHWDGEGLTGAGGVGMGIRLVILANVKEWMRSLK